MVDSFAMDGDGRRIVIVGGAPRSGTTLLQNILDSHPDIHGGPEFAHLPGIAHLSNALHAGVDSGGLEHFVSHEDARMAVATFIETLLLPAADRAGKELLSEKTPSNVLVGCTLLDLLPAARAIFIVRDPRATVASMVEIGERHARRNLASPAGFQNLDQMIHTIAAHLDGIAAAVSAQAGRIHIVLYEDLVTNTGRECRQICEFLGVDFADEMTRAADTQQPPREFVEGLWHTNEEYERGPEYSRIDGWKQVLGPDELQMIEERLSHHHVMRAFGYVLDGSADGPVIPPNLIAVD